jgi:hypothetical protein
MLAQLEPFSSYAVSADSPQTSFPVPALSLNSSSVDFAFELLLGAPVAMQPIMGVPYHSASPDGRPPRPFDPVRKDGMCDHGRFSAGVAQLPPAVARWPKTADGAALMAESRVVLAELDRAEMVGGCPTFTYRSTGNVAKSKALIDMIGICLEMTQSIPVTLDEPGDELQPLSQQVPVDAADVGEGAPAGSISPMQMTRDLVSPPPSPSGDEPTDVPRARRAASAARRAQSVATVVPSAEAAEGTAAKKTATPQSEAEPRLVQGSSFAVRPRHSGPSFTKEQLDATAPPDLAAAVAIVEMLVTSNDNLRMHKSVKPLLERFSPRSPSTRRFPRRRRPMRTRPHVLPTTSPHATQVRLEPRRLQPSGGSGSWHLGT